MELTSHDDWIQLVPSLWRIGRLVYRMDLPASVAFNPPKGAWYRERLSGLHREASELKNGPNLIVVHQWSS
jgi:hypothetical protein